MKVSSRSAELGLMAGTEEEEEEEGAEAALAGGAVM